MRPRTSGRLAAALACAAALLVLPQPGAAQTLEELDQLVQTGAKPKNGLELARTQAGEGAWLEALATLERVLAADPKHKQARLLHASILCRIDDPDGATLEFSRIKAGDYKKADWSAARAPCLAPAEAGR